MKSSKQSWGRPLYLITGTLIFSFSFLQLPAVSAPQKTDKQKMINEGKKLYQTNCSTCHGAKGAGDGPASSALNPKPNNFTKGKFKFGGSDVQLFNTISKGVSGSAMPPWKGTLSDGQIKNVIAYIKSLKK